MAVYVDVLLTLNYVVDLTLLYAAGRMFHLPCRRKRLCFGALIGALGALWIFVPLKNPLPQVLFKTALTLLMGGTAFGFRPWKRLLRGCIAVSVCGGLFAGVLLAAEVLFSPPWLYRRGSVLYAPIEPLTLLLWTAFFYALLWLLTPLFWGKPTAAQTQPQPLEIHAFGRQTRLQVLPDSGNLLREPFSGKLVLVCRADVLSVFGDIPPNRFRLIPCVTVTGEEALHAFLPDALYLAEQHLPMDTVYVAAGKTPFPPEYDGILHPSALQSNHT